MADASIYVPKYLFQIDMYSELYLAHDQKKYYHFVVLDVLQLQWKKYETCKVIFCHKNIFMFLPKFYHYTKRNALLGQVKNVLYKTNIYMKVNALKVNACNWLRNPALSIVHDCCCDPVSCFIPGNFFCIQIKTSRLCHNQHLNNSSHHSSLRVCICCCYNTVLPELAPQNQIFWFPVLNLEQKKKN